jgi:hypothetical protein
MPNLAEISRTNGAKSQGPVTAEGKARSSQNSRTHGLTSAAVVLPHESQEDYDLLELAIVQEFRPVGPLQQDLVQEMAAARWRLRRVQQMESAIFQKAVRTQLDKLGPRADPAEARMLAYAAVADSNSLRMVTRYAAQFRRAYEKAWKELLELQRRNAAEPPSQRQTEPVPIDPVQNEPGKQLFSPDYPHSYIGVYNATFPAKQFPVSDAPKNG